ncbi:MAG TPA: PIN domain-containing protein [Nitrolancea sp.]|nr:PIN domain-containing protein [Nitrolancea sp.]
MIGQNDSKIRTFIDTGVLIATARGETNEMFQRAFAILDDPNRLFVSSDFVRLELMPKPVFNRRTEEVAFYIDFFDATGDWVDSSAELIDQAYDYGCRFGLSAFDSLHIAAASLAGADEFVTTERIHSPLLRVPASVVLVRTIHSTRP